MPKTKDPLEALNQPVRTWFRRSFAEPTAAQRKGWPPILEGRSTLLLAPTGSGKTLAAFLAAIDRLMFSPEPHKSERCRVLYVSPLKALGADVERNLYVPIRGIEAAAAEVGAARRVPTIALRSGDTSASERAKIGRAPPDILITTPESLYLLLTSNARSILASVETVIIDEIHSVVGTKRGAHLSLSLERLEEIRTEKGRPLQRIGLSATQRPLDAVARMLGGAEGAPLGAFASSSSSPRPVEIVDAGTKKAWELLVEVPVEDMAKLSEAVVPPSQQAAGEPHRGSIWPSMYPRLVELVRAHRSTMIFANSRRLSERLAAAINDLAGEEIALAHHGSLARERRASIEERLKRGELPAIIATSSLELGIDVGAVDLVVQIESPPSVASGLQRIGRAGHSVGAVSRGVIFPKHRGDLLACAAATARMAAGEVEETLYLRNPLDVLAQQIVAIVSMDRVDVDDLYALVRRSACFVDLPRASFEGVLDMLSGRYPSDEFAELRPRITWDRTTGELRAREGARRIAVINGGTIPDRGLYGVFLASSEAGGSSRRVGELDEEMVFEARVGDVFLLGASSWRIEEITHDRVLVSPAPGQPGKMPFWHGDRPYRPVELGRAMGALARTLAALPEKEAKKRLREGHGLDERASSNLVAYLAEQGKATGGEVPSDKTIVIERYIDEIGTFCVCVLSPFGARVHAPWSQAVLARLALADSARAGTGVEAMWSDDGIVFRSPDSEEPPDVSLFLPSPDEVEDLLVKSLGGTSLFAARFRENAARALLLPRRRPGQRTPLWAQRKRASDLLAVASRFGSFPIVMETYRECLRDVFDVPALIEILRQIKAKRIKTRTVDSRAPSPFAKSLLFSYVASFIYDGDAPLAERRAQALSVDPAELRELLGEAELRELLDPAAIAETERLLQRLDERRRATSADALHDMLLSLGDLTREEARARCEPASSADGWLDELARARRSFEVTIAGERRFAAVEDASRLAGALGAALPRWIPAALLEPVASPLGDLVSRYARTHGPFLLESLAARLGVGAREVREVLVRLAEAERVVEGEILPGGSDREWCDASVLRDIKRRSLAKLRREVEPVEGSALARFSLEWHGLDRRRSGVDALMSAIERLAGAPLPASVLESEVLPARISAFRPADLDLLCASGEVAWVGIEPLGPNDGRIALYFPDQLARLAPTPRRAEGELASRARSLLASRGALFFSDLLAETGAFSADLLKALWDLVWAGEVTNDTLAPLRSVLRSASPDGRARAKKAERSQRYAARSFGLRRAGPPGSEGRWSLLPIARPPEAQAALKITPPSETERRAALAKALLDRHGVVTREAVHAEGTLGGFSAVYDVLKAMEDAGRVRRGYFVAGLGAAQFAVPGAEERLRAHRERPSDPEVIMIAATDPANPYGAALPWPERQGAKPGRAAGAHVILRGGDLLGFLGRTERSLLTFFPEEEPERTRAATSLARALSSVLERDGGARRKTLLIADVDGQPTEASPFAQHLSSAGFTPTIRGFFKRAVRQGP